MHEAPGSSIIRAESSVTPVLRTALAGGCGRAGSAGFVAGRWVARGLDTASTRWQAAVLSFCYTETGERPAGQARWVDPPRREILNVTPRRTESALLHFWVREPDCWHGYITYLDRELLPRATRSRHEQDCGQHLTVTVPTPTAALRLGRRLRHYPLEQFPQPVRHQPLNDSHHNRQPAQPNEMACY
jgi:hypothetical protein